MTKLFFPICDNSEKNLCKRSAKQIAHISRHHVLGGQDVRFSGRFARDGQQQRGVIRGDRYVSEPLCVLLIKVWMGNLHILQKSRGL